ncbi:MAG: GNAT family N-acetyltransferase [Thermoguttaceae bacterium]
MPLSRIETPRLTLSALSRKELELFLWDRVGFARDQGLVAAPRPPTEEVQAGLEWLYDVGKEYNDSERIWGSLWTVVWRPKGLFVGAFCFKGKPIEREAELAYYMEESFQNRGIMTETLVAIIDWARRRDDVDALGAETEISNRASQRALESAGFHRVAHAPFTLVDSFYWRRALDDP